MVKTRDESEVIMGKKRTPSYLSAEDRAVLDRREYDNSVIDTPRHNRVEVRVAYYHDPAKYPSAPAYPRVTPRFYLANWSTYDAACIDPGSYEGSCAIAGAWPEDIYVDSSRNATRKRREETARLVLEAFEALGWTPTPEELELIAAIAAGPPTARRRAPQKRDRVLD